MVVNNWMDKFMKVKEQGMTALDKGLTQLDQGFNTMKAKGSLTLEKAKIQSKIDGINAEINKLMRSVGELAYSQWGSSEPIALEEKFAEIKQKKDEILELNKKIEEIKIQEEQISLNAAGGNLVQDDETVEEVFEKPSELYISQNVSLKEE